MNESAFYDQRFLVTGGAGFIGSYLVEELVRRGASVSVIDNLSSGLMENLDGVRDRIEFHKLDLLDDDLRPLLARSAFDTIFHLAGHANAHEAVLNPQKDFEKNAGGTLSLLEAVRTSSPESKLVYTSSATVYGALSEKPFIETDPTVPETPYGISKLAGENYMRAYASLFDMKTAILRLFVVFGPRLRKQVVYDLIQKLLRDPNELFIYGDGTQARDMNFIRNVIDAHLMVASRARFQGDIYNVGSGEVVTIRRLAEMICEAMDLQPEFVFSGDVRTGDSLRLTADFSALEDLGYAPKVGIREGLDEVVAWCRGDSGT